MSNLAFWIALGVSVGIVVVLAIIVIAVAVDYASWFDDDPVENDPRDVANLDDIYTASVANGALNMPLHDGEVTR